MKLTLESDARFFDAMVAELARVCEAPPDEVLLEEIGRVLTQAIKETKAATKESIVAHAASKTHTLQPSTLYTPKHPQRRKLRKGKVLYNLSYRYPPRLWAAIVKARAADLKRRIAARGLAKQSWYKLGLLLGVAVEAPEYVKKAVPITGKTYQDERVQVSQGNGTNAYTLQTNQPTLLAIGGEEALERAVQGRIGYFVTNVTKNVFDKLADIAKKYPGIKVS